MDISSLKMIGLFSGLDQDQIEHITAMASIRQYEKNAIILFENDSDRKLNVILSGSVKLTSYHTAGREFVYSFLNSGDVFGVLSILDDEIRTTNVVAILQTRVLEFERTHYLNLLRDFPQITLNLLKEMSRRLRKRDTQIKSMTLQNATGKVASTLLGLTEDAGEVREGQIEVNSIPPHRDIANMVGTSRETISRALQWLTEEGFVQRVEGRLIIKDYQNFRTAFS